MLRKEGIHEKLVDLHLKRNPVSSFQATIVDLKISLSQMSEGIFSRLILIISCFIFFTITSCRDMEIVPEPFQPRTDHEAYLYSLEQAGLLSTAIGKEWESNAFDLLYEPVSANLPLLEKFYLDASKPDGVAYRFDVKRGQAIKVDVTLDMQDSLLLFIDLFRVENDSQGLYWHVASADPEQLLLAFEPRVDAEYVLRVQPELLRGGHLEIEISKEPSLDFPVLGASNRDIGSFFGDPRDGGRRKHHGVDIFARRHTPIIAPTEGYIRFSGERGLGGRVVWMRDTKRDQTLYFAHLHDIFVEKGDRISKGDTLGTVGNTGNARTTPPHLHFGIYKSGPLDPYHHIALTKTRNRPIEGDQNLLGTWVRAQRSIDLYDKGDRRSSQTERLPKFQMMKVVAASSNFYRVEMPDGRQGYVSLNGIENISDPIRSQQLAADITMLDKPMAQGIPKTDLEIGEEIQIHGSHDEYWYVSEFDGMTGWISLP